MTHEQVRHIIKWAYSIGDRVNSFHNFNQLATAYLEAHPEATAPPIPDTAPVHTVTAPPTLRERAVAILDSRLMEHNGKWVFDDEGIIQAMLQFASEVSAEKEEELNRWRSALLGLTPSGSEFADDPRKCFDFIKEYQDGQREFIIEQNKRISELEAEVKRLNDMVDNLNIEQEKPFDQQHGSY